MHVKPHLRLHHTPIGDWWISLHHPGDKGYTLKSTANYVDSVGALIAAKFMLPMWRTRWIPRYIDAQFGVRDPVRDGAV